MQAIQSFHQHFAPPEDTTECSLNAFRNIQVPNSNKGSLDQSEMVMMEDRDPRKSPPEDMKNLFKLWKRFVDDDSELARSLRHPECFQSQDWYPEDQLPAEAANAFHKFAGTSGGQKTIYRSKVIPGLVVLPDLLDVACQELLLDRLLHRDLANPAHKTNLSLHYDAEYPNPGKSFLDYSPEDVPFVAKDQSIHPNLSIKRALEAKLRWITLGGQYDWSKKLYPDGCPPAFPEDIRNLLSEIFPDMEPQAAIVNFYSPGDTLSLHRDVSEEVDRGLVSVSLGCDGIFIIGLHSDGDPDGKSQYQVLRLRSGDAVYMSGRARYAWHGVPRIISNTCPKTLEDWPGQTHQDWRGYMSNKRVNLNVRQMFET